MTPMEIKAYFDQNAPPETHELHPWAIITDCNMFLQSCYNELANYNGTYEKCPSYWPLKNFYLQILELRKKE